uniref:Uncharacterized protein n=1 Tax=Aegilops tauschii TaxID=37682 RepID=R7W467_AEGTA
MAAWLARRAARRLAGELCSHGPGPWPLSLSTVPVLGVPSGDQSRGFCSVRRFAGDSTAAAAVEEPENGLAAGDLQGSSCDVTPCQLIFRQRVNFIGSKEASRGYNIMSIHPASA